VKKKPLKPKADKSYLSLGVSDNYFFIDVDELTPQTFISYQAKILSTITDSMMSAAENLSSIKIFENTPKTILDLSGIKNITDDKDSLRGFDSFRSEFIDSKTLFKDLVYIVCRDWNPDIKKVLNKVFFKKSKNTVIFDEIVSSQELCSNVFLNYGENISSVRKVVDDAFDVLKKRIESNKICDEKKEGDGEVESESA